MNMVLVIGSLVLIILKYTKVIEISIWLALFPVFFLMAYYLIQFLIVLIFGKIIRKNQQKEMKRMANIMNNFFNEKS